jgi:hypothetical protein
MKNKLLKKIVWFTASFLLLMIVVLGAHIYIMTRPKAPTASTRIMARIDFKQDITNDDASKITSWLYQQKGVDHVLCNATSNIAVFTFYPVKANADNIISNLKSNLNYKAQRFMPSEKDLQNGCPVAAVSLTYKIVNFFKQNF